MKPLPPIGANQTQTLELGEKVAQTCLMRYIDPNLGATVGNRTRDSTLARLHVTITPQSQHLIVLYYASPR